MEEVANPLSELRDIHLPSDPALWPPAPGWWLAGIVLILMAAWLAWLMRRIRKRTLPKRTFQADLMRLDTHTEQMPLKLERVREMSRLMRQYAIHKFGRDTVSGLHGTAWLQFLDHSTDSQVSFTQGPGRVFGQDQYASRVDVDLEALKRLLIAWVQKV
ncbi:MAG: DUF4381 domain-containing protein [Gammaproteobacteria bacterium]|nr:DUF4381 domain-containing protein [Gammaproteobacteria bacterium]